MNNVEDYETTSLAKGAFAFKRGKPVTHSHFSAKLPSKKKRSESKKKSLVSKTLYNTPSKASQKTYKSYSTIWERSQKEFEAIQQDLFSDVLNAVTSFCQRETSQSSNELLGSSASIPTCMLLSGVNLPDHEDFFRLLRNELRNNVSPHLASIQMAGSGSVGSNLTQRQLVQATVSQLMHVSGHFELDDDEDEASQERNDLNRKKIDLTLPSLDAWYNNQYPLEFSPSPQKKKKESSKKLERSPLVIILEDFEAISGRVLQDFILNLVEYVTRLPFILVFGVATNAAVVHQKLPHNISTHLLMEKFTGHKSTEMLSKLVERILIDPKMPFKLGGKALTLLMEIFHFSDFSIKRFFSCYKFCLKEHFTSSLLPEILCLNSGTRKKKAIISCPDTLDHCRSLPSFRALVESDIQGYAQLLIDNNLFEQFLCEKLEEMEERNHRFNIGVKFLFVLTKDLPNGRNFGFRLSSVYREALCKAIFRTPEYTEAFRFLGHISEKALMTKLEFLASLLKESSLDDFKDVLKETDDFKRRLEIFLREGPEVSISTSHSNLPSSASVQNVPSVQKKGQRVSLKELQRELLEHARSVKEKENLYENLRKQALSFFHKFFEENLIPPTTLPFSEIFYFNKVSKIQRHLIAFPRGVIKTALEDPIVYLEDPSLDIESKFEISTSFPEASIAYKLHSEMGNLINLHDWLQSWLCIMQEGEQNSGEEEVDPVLYAKFTESVSALQFIGFVAPSKRKLDHMSKLTWAE